MRNTNLLIAAACIGAGLGTAGCSRQTVEEQPVEYILVEQEGPTLGYSPTSGVTIIRQDGHAFKDHNRNGQLDPFEDWRLSPEERANDLASRLNEEEIAGLMLYSSHQAIPGTLGWSPSTWGGMDFDESGALPWQLTDQQKQFLRDDNLRHVLITSVKDPATAALWNNAEQAFVEGLGQGIPCNNSSDPRHSASHDVEFNAGGGGAISLWPNELGMGATFDPDLLLRFGQVASAEYRALGIATALSPQVDIATDPRWMRFFGTYGEDPQLVTDMARAYCDGFQTTADADGCYGAGWGRQSVNAMVKHWPGGGPCEAGRDAHFGRGKYAVYPNQNITLQKQAFVEGAFRLEDGTRKAAAVMPYYTISVGISDEAVANNFNQQIVTQQLRTEAGYDGVVCTDWGVTADQLHPGLHSGKPWGVERLSVAERHAKALKAGVDQFGGNDDKQPVLEAFGMLADEVGRDSMLMRIRQSARRLLVNIFHTGLFENPYLNPEESARLVGNADFMAEGYNAQLRSIVMLKNHDKALPLRNAECVRAYIPKQHVPDNVGFFGMRTEARDEEIVPADMANRYFTPVSSADSADVAILFISSPYGSYGYSLSEGLTDEAEIRAIAKRMAAQYNSMMPEFIIDLMPISKIRQLMLPEDDLFFIPETTQVAAPGNGYYPISLQYTDYVATDARDVSLAADDSEPAATNRSYLGKGVRTANRCDLELVQQTRRQLPEGARLVVVINCKNPVVLREIEPLCDALLVTFDVQSQAVLDIITGRAEPQALLPFQMPADMATVELQAEDTPHDMRCHVDTEGNTYDFGFGLNWNGTICDERTERYRYNSNGSQE